MFRSHNLIPFVTIKSVVSVPIDITTIEGIAQDSGLHAVQQAIVESGGTQCGFCTPGIILSAVALLNENPTPSESDIRHAIAGNICRCTGYDKVVRAIAQAATTRHSGA